MVSSVVQKKPSDITDISDVKKKVSTPLKTYSTMESVYTNNVRKKQYNVRLPLYQIEFLHKLPKGESSIFIRKAIEEKIQSARQQTSEKCIYKDHSAIHSQDDSIHPELMSETSETSEKPKPQLKDISPEELMSLPYDQQLERLCGKAEADRWRKENPQGGVPHG